MCMHQEILFMNINKVKYINQHANEISQQEYIDQSNNAYIATYVGCTYHCG